MTGKVYVNRTLNLKRIRYIGLDMDHTLIRYNSEEFERLSHTAMKEKLVKNKNYPAAVKDLVFDYNFAIRGLVVDRKKGNLLKLNRHSAIRASFHGTAAVDFKTQQKIYKSTYIDLSDDDYLAVDTTFSISLAVLFSQIIELKKFQPAAYPDYSIIADDVLMALDEAHRDGTLKDIVKKDLQKFIVKDPEVVAGLEKFKRHGKKIFVLTNSDYQYTKMLLDYAINPFLKEHKSWQDLFEIVITFAQKPKFFFDSLKYLKIDPQTGMMSNLNDEKLGPGIYQGGEARTFTRDLGLEGDEILYIGDHIYGDILRLKKDCGWRTAMVIEELESEVNANKKADPLIREIEILMKKKEPLEDELTELMTQKAEAQKVDDARIDKLQHEIADIDAQISGFIKKQQSMYNSNWGQLMRAGNEESHFAYQVDRFACIYMTKLSELLDMSPRSYFRAPRRPLSHEIY